MTAREKEAPEPKTPDAKRYRLTKKSEDPVWPYPMQAAMGADSPGVLADAVADAAPKQKDEFESRLLEITTEQDSDSSRLQLANRRLPMRPVRRAEEVDEAPKPKRRRDDEDEAAASSAEVPLLAMHMLPPGGLNSLPDVLADVSEDADDESSDSSNSDSDSDSSNSEPETPQKDPIEPETRQNDPIDVMLEHVVCVQTNGERGCGKCVPIGEGVVGWPTVFPWGLGRPKCVQARAGRILARFLSGNFENGSSSRPWPHGKTFGRPRPTGRLLANLP